MIRTDILYVQQKGIRIDAPTSTYHLVFKHLRGWYLGRTLRSFLTGGKEYTREGIEELLISTTEPLPESMHCGHRLASAAYALSDGGPYELTGGPMGVGVTVLESRTDGSVPRNVLRRGALTAAITNLPPVDRAYFHIYMSLLEGRDLIPILRRALMTRDGNNNDVLTLHLLGRYRDCCHNPGGISTAHGGKYRVFLEDRFNQAHPTQHP
jgi:hypothetical protein